MTDSIRESFVAVLGFGLVVHFFLHYYVTGKSDEESVRWRSQPFWQYGLYAAPCAALVPAALWFGLWGAAVFFVLFTVFFVSAMIIALVAPTPSDDAVVGNEPSTLDATPVTQ